MSVVLLDLVGVGVVHETDIRREVPSGTPVVPIMGPKSPHPPKLLNPQEDVTVSAQWPRPKLHTSKVQQLSCPSNFPDSASVSSSVQFPHAGTLFEELNSLPLKSKKVTGVESEGCAGSNLRIEN